MRRRSATEDTLISYLAYNFIESVNVMRMTEDYKLRIALDKYKLRLEPDFDTVPIEDDE